MTKCFLHNRMNLGGIIMQDKTLETGYYLPLNYNDNKIVLLVRDPYKLFAYWEISNDKNENFISEFGKEAWNNSKPVLKVTNVTHSKVYFVDIDAFASNWYLEVNQPNCYFTAEVGRLFRNDLFVAFASSNSVHTPFNKPAKDTSIYMAHYKNVNKKRKVKISVKTDLGKYEPTFIDNRVGLSSATLSNVSSESFIK